MLLRALLVMLLVLNAGVAAWWLLRAPMRAAGPVAQPAGVPLLELASAAPAPAARSTPASDLRCYRYGPFGNPDAFEAARRAIAGEVRWTATARQPLGPPRAWRVVMPQPSRAQALAMADRIRGAGFSDLLVLPEGGADSNAIALGRYRSEASARERARALAEAGFDTRAEPVGVRETLWLDVAADAAFAPASATLGLTGTAIDCAGVVRDGRYTIPAPA